MTKISVVTHGLVNQHNVVRALLKAIDVQFITSDKALANTLIMKLSPIKVAGVRGICEHIIQMKDIAAQLKLLEVDMCGKVTWFLSYF